MRNLIYNSQFIIRNFFLITLSSVFLLIVNYATAQDKSNDDMYSLIPYPQSVKTINTRAFKLTSASSIIYDQSDAKHVAEMLASYLKPATGFDLNLKNGEKALAGDIFISIVGSKEKFGNEGYSLNINNDYIKITASSPSGAFYGIQTLRQLFPIEIFSNTKIDNIVANINWECPAVEIYDNPRFTWRGMHLDVCRHFMPIEAVKKYIDELALHKLNTFHWHLTEDQGWRIEIKKYPKLTEIGAWRDETLIGHASDRPKKYDRKRHGGFYTQEQIREIVKYASDRYITIVPEIEMPGHAQAAVSAYPEYGCTNKSPGLMKEWGVSTDIYNPEDKTIKFLENVLTEVMDLFPGKFIHIGGDEALKTQWEQSERIQQLLKERNLKDMHEMQSWFIKQIDVFLNEKGRQLIGWDEILEGGLAKGATVMSWRGSAGGIAAAKKGNNVVMASNEYTYFDHYQDKNKTKEPLAIGGFLPLSKVYSFDPIPAELSKEEAKHILGAQAQIWTEYIKTFEHVEYMAFPRLCALSEVVWLENDKKNYARFIKRLNTHLKRLDLLKINYRKM